MRPWPSTAHAAARSGGGAEARSFLKRLQHELGATTVYVTHDQSEALALADRMAVMDAGRVRQLGTPVEVFRRPANLFVAGFIGSTPMNLLEAP